MAAVILSPTPWTILGVRLDCPVEERRLRHFRLAAHGNDELDAVHLPDIPADDFGELQQRLGRPFGIGASFAEEIRIEALYNRGENVFPR